MEQENYLISLMLGKKLTPEQRKEMKEDMRNTEAELREIDRHNGFVGNLSEENFKHTVESPANELELRYRFCDGENKEIPLDCYPVELQPIIVKWRDILGNMPGTDSNDYQFAQVSVMYKGSYFSFSCLNLGGTIDEFAAHDEEISNDFIEAGCAARIEEWIC